MVTIGFIDTLVASDVVVNVTNYDIPCKDAKDVNDSLSTVASDIKHAVKRNASFGDCGSYMQQLHHQVILIVTEEIKDFDDCLLWQIF